MSQLIRTPKADLDFGLHLNAIYGRKKDLAEAPPPKLQIFRSLRKQESQQRSNSQSEHVKSQKLIWPKEMLYLQNGMVLPRERAILKTNETNETHKKVLFKNQQISNIL